MNNVITIPNIHEYRFQIIYGNLILTKIITNIDEELSLTNNVLLLNGEESSFNDEESINNDSLSLLNEELLFSNDISGSTIKECKINDKDISINKYNQLLIYIYSITDKETIKKYNNKYFITTKK